MRAFRIFALCLLVILLPAAVFYPFDRAAAIESAKIAAAGVAVFLAVRLLAGRVSGHAVAHALCRLHCPEPILLMVFQIVHQVPAFRRECLKVSRALRVRNGFTRHGWLAPSCLAALPTIGLIRAVHRAERVGQAMELRGFGSHVN